MYDSLKTSLLWGWAAACVLGLLFVKILFEVQLSWGHWAALAAFPFGLGWLILFFLFRRVYQSLQQLSVLQQDFLSERFDARLNASSADELGLVFAQVNQLLDLEQNRLKKIKIELKQMQTVLDHMTEPVMAVDKNGKVLLMNPACRQMFNSNQAVLGLPYMQVLRQSVLTEALQQTLTEGKKNSAVVRLFLSPEKIVQMQTLPLKLEQGTGALLVLHDVTAVKNLEQVRRDFVSNISHELRTPLTSIQGYAETLLSGALKDSACAKEFVEIIYQQAQHLTELTNQLLDLASIESGKAIAEKTKINLFASSRQTIELLYPIAQKNGIEFENLIDPSLEIKFNLDHWTQILTNLISNAVKFNRAGGKVILNAHADEAKIEFIVQDTGIGIELKNLERIFERFYQVDPARTQGSKGSGLGLSIVKHIIENSAGKIKAESVLGQGTKIIVSLPR